MNPTLAFSQSRIAAMKNVLAEGRLTQRGGGVSPTDHICGRRVPKGSTSPAPLPLHSTPGTPTQSDTIFAP